MSEPGSHYYTSNFYSSGQQQDLLGTPTKTPRRVARDQLARLQRQFARPGGINAAYDILEAEHTVFITGDRGSGRSSAARVLLCELPAGGGTYHELTPGDGNEGTACLPTELVGQEDRMLLDLSGVEEALGYTTLHALSEFRVETLRKRAFLAVVLPRRFATRLPSEFVRRAIQRPEDREVLVRHLRSHGLEDGPWQRDLPPPVRDHLRTLPSMYDLARLAERIAAARTSADGRGTFTDWCETALAAQRDRTQEIAELLPRLRKSRQRALLLSAAMLHGARVEAVHHATPLLLKTADSAEDPSPPLERKGLLERLHSIGAEMDTDSCVRFKEPYFDDAARRYLWASLPDIRAPLGNWLGKILGLSKLTPKDREELVNRYTDLCLSSKDADVLFGLVESWTRNTASRNTEVRAAAQLLKRGVDNEQAGGAFRSKIYEWSIGRPTGHLREVLAEVCEKAMSIRHPEPALVRLHHLARNEVRPGIARKVLMRYAGQDNRLQHRLLARMAVAHASQHRVADADLFLDFAGLPDEFLLDSTTREWLTTCWRMAFELRPQPRWGPCAHNWLAGANAVADSSLRDAALMVLVDAAAADYTVLSRVYADASRKLSPSLATQLLEAIDKAQGARFAQRSPKLEDYPI